MTVLDEGLAYFDAAEYEKAYESLIGLAEDGNDEAQYLIGLLYYRGDHVELNIDEAIKWFKRSARKNNIEAMNMLMETEGTTTRHTNRF